MNSRERIFATLADQRVDHVALLGGFLVAQTHYCGVTGATEPQFDADPEGIAIEAYRRLGVDGLILLRLPPGKEGHWTYRAMDKAAFDAHQQRFPDVDAVRDYVLALPSADEALASFDSDAYRQALRDEIHQRQVQLGGMLYLPAQWDVVHPTFEHYNHFGYEKYMELLALYPEAAEKLFGHTDGIKRRIAEIVVEVWGEFDLPKLVFIGTDICGKGGPVASPGFLREHYFPHVEYCLWPLVEAGFSLVWHSDGVIGPLVDDLLACGVGGFQGFQWEYGVRVEDFVGKRTRAGQRLTMFAGPSTSSTLPFGTLEDVRREIDYVLGFSEEFRLFVLPGNDVLPDTPVEHVIEFHRRAIEQSAIG